MNPASLVHLLLDELDAVFDRHGVHSGGGTHLELLDRPLVVDLFGGNPQFLGKELADLMGDQAIVHPDRTNAGAPAAQGAAVGQLRQPGDRGPVQINVAGKLGREFPIGFDIFPVEPPQNFGPKVWAVNFLAPADFENRAGLGAGLAFGAVVHGKEKRLEESPVVFLLKQLPQSREKGPEVSLLFLLVLGLGNPDGDGIVQRSLHVGDLLLL